MRPQMIKYTPQMFNHQDNGTTSANGYNFSEQLIFAIQQKLCQFSNRPLHIIAINELRQIYEATGQSLKPKSAKLARQSDIDNLSNYLHVTRELKLDNVYTPYDRKETESVVIHSNEDSVEQFADVIKNSATFYVMSVIMSRWMYCQYSPSGTIKSLSAYVSVPLTDQQSIFSTVWELVITIPEKYAAKFTQTYELTNEQAKDLTLDVNLNQDAGASSIINMMTIPDVSSQQIIQQWRQLQQLASHPTYLTQEMTDLPPQKLAQLADDANAQYHKLCDQLCDISLLQTQLSTSNQMYHVRKLTGIEQDEIQKVLIALIDSQVVKQALAKVNGRVATAQDMLAALSSSQTAASLVTARKLITASRHVVTPFCDDDVLNQSLQNKLLQPIADELDVFHHSKLLPTDHRKYLSQFASMGSQILVTSKQIVAAIWFCITDDQCSWIVPLELMVTIDRHQSSMIVTPSVQPGAKPSVHLTATDSAPISVRQAVRYAVANNLIPMLDNSTKQITVRRKSYRDRLDQYFDDCD